MIDIINDLSIVSDAINNGDLEDALKIIRDIQEDLLILNELQK
jgi:hypothetical protein